MIITKRWKKGCHNKAIFLVIEKIFGNNIFFEIQNIYRERY